MRKGKKKLAQMMAAVLTATTLLQTPVSVFADPVVKEQVEKEASEGDSETTQEPEDEKEAEKNETSEDEKKEDSKEDAGEDPDQSEDGKSDADSDDSEDESKEDSKDGKEGDDSDKEETGKDSEQDKKEDSDSVDSKEDQDTSEKEDAKKDAEEAEEPEEEPEKKPGILDKILDALFPKKEIPEEEIEEVEEATPSELIAPQSLLAPAEVVDAYVLLNNDSYTTNQDIPVSDILENMKSLEDGSDVELPEDYDTILWTKGEWVNSGKNDKVLDNPMEVFMDGVITIRNAGHRTSCNLEFLVGTGKQLDDDATRYKVRVYLRGRIEEQLDFSIYDDAGHELYGDWKTDTSEMDSEDLTVTARKFYCDEYQKGETYKLKLDSFVKRCMNQDMSVKAYRTADYVDHLENNILSGATELTDELFKTGYESEFTEPDEFEDDNLITIAYMDPATNVVLGSLSFEVDVLPEEEGEILGQFYAYENGSMKPVSEEEYGNLYSGSTFYCWMRYTQNGYSIIENEYSNMDVDEVFYELEKGYTPVSKIYYLLDIDGDKEVSKVYLGYRTDNDEYICPETFAEAEQNGAKDITDEVLKQPGKEAPYGYQLQPEDYMQYYEGIMEDDLAELEVWGMFGLTVFFEDGTCYMQEVEVDALEDDYDGDLEEDDGPIVGREDPYFQMQSANEVSYANSFYVKNTPSYTMDTYYGYGYQTVFLMDEQVDLSTLHPVFWNASDMKVHSGEKQISGVSEKNFSDGPVQYVVHNDKKKRNYQVSFVKKESGPSLYVFGPEMREVYLTDYFKYRHDILIANVGSEALTGLKVELENAKNVALDNYWTLGGNGNDTLGAFTSTSVRYTGDHVDMPNLAKVRLVPDGEGEISGTLVISTDGQEPVEIELQGYAEDPHFTTDELSDAVKYVPYSYMLATSNIHQETTETYKITDGELPEGLSLNAATGEIYGVPLETGEFTFTVKVTYSKAEFLPSLEEFTLTVLDNTNQNVHDASDAGYEVKEYLGTEMAQGTYDYLISGLSDELFVSNGLYDEFVGLWLNGEKLVDGVDFTKVSGSTRMTIRSQTFQNKGRSGINTIAAEFRTGSGSTKVLKRTAQNFRITGKNQGDNGNNNNGNNNSNNNNGNSQTNTNTGNRTSSSRDTGSSAGSWSRENGKWRYKNPNGTYAANEWKQLSYNGAMEWYYFGADGTMMTGWLVLNGKTYYLNLESDGTQGKMCTGWKLIDGIWYFFNDSSDMEQRGVMTTGGWQYLAYNGTMEWYFFNEQGQMQTGWVTDGDKKYYLYPIADGTRGRMLTGWQTIDGKEYYLNEVSDGTKGAMATSTRIGDRYVDQNGVRVR